MPLSGQTKSSKEKSDIREQLQDTIAELARKDAGIAGLSLE